MKSPLVLWHASRADIDRPTIAGRSVGERHANSGLGIYCATGQHDYIVGFGEFLQKIEIKPDVRVRRIKIEDLMNMGHENGKERDRDWFESERQRISETHDVMLIIESNGYASQAIILNDHAIASSQKVSRDDFLAGAISISDAMQDHDEKQKRIAQAHAMQSAVGL